MVNLDSITNENNKKWLYIPDHPYRILIINASGSGKINALINVINEQDYIDKIYLFAKDLNKYEKRKDAGIKHLNNLNSFVECVNTMDDIYKNINDYNASKKTVIVFDDIIADIMTNKKFQAIINELLVRCRIFLHYKMINLDSIRNENNKEHQEKWSYIPDLLTEF